MLKYLFWLIVEQTHKTAEGGRIQLEGIPKEDQAIIVSTMAELKFFADRGFNNITYDNIVYSMVAWVFLLVLTISMIYKRSQRE